MQQGGDLRDAHFLGGRPGGSSAGVAAELGYFDQSHLTHEVAVFAGASPRHIARHQVADFSATRCG